MSLMAKHHLKDAGPYNNRGIKLTHFFFWISSFLLYLALSPSPETQSKTQQRHSKHSGKTIIPTFFITIATVALICHFRATKSTHTLQDELLNTVESRDDLITFASHQLRTPATSVKQYIGMLMEGYAGELNPDQSIMLQKAYNSNERQLEIIDQMLYVAKADAGKLKLSKSYFDINILIKDIVSELMPFYKEKRQQLELISGEIGSPIHADINSIRMVLENLLNNASKYSLEGGKVIVQTNKLDNQVSISVKDNGIGIKEKDFPKLFQKYSRIDNKLSSNTSGSGIGLYLVKIITELHGGTVNVSSEPNKGTQFTIVLPV